MKKKRHLCQTLEKVKCLLVLATLQKKYTSKEKRTATEARCGGVVLELQQRERERERLRQERRLTKFKAILWYVTRPDLKDKKDRKHIYRDFTNNLPPRKQVKWSQGLQWKKRKSVRKPIGWSENPSGRNRNENTS